MAEKRIEYASRFPMFLRAGAEITTRKEDSKEDAESMVNSVNRKLKEKGLLPIGTVVAREVIVGDWKNVSEIDGA